MVGAILLLPLGLAGFWRGWHISIKPVRIMFRGAGMVLGTFGIWYNEYKKVHGV